MRIYSTKVMQTFFAEANTKIKNPLAYFILQYTPNANFSFLDVSEDDRVILTPEVKIKKLYNEATKNIPYVSFDTYVYNNLVTDYTSTAYTKNRIEIKMGRLLKKIIEDNKKQWDALIISWRESYTTGTEGEIIEELVNQYKAYTKRVFDTNFDSRIELVSGQEIRKWYFEGNYMSGKGSIHESCMRYSKCQNFFEIYENNPEVCNLLIFKPEKDKISIRALIWTLSNGNKYMDRIYCSNFADNTIFINYAKKHGWIIYDEIKNDKINIEIHVKVAQYRYYPYMDTFKWYNRTTGLLTKIRQGGQVNLISTGGGYD